MPGYEREMGEVQAKIENLQRTMESFAEQITSEMRILFGKIDALYAKQAADRRQTDASIAELRLETTKETTKNTVKISAIVTLLLLCAKRGMDALGRLW